MPKASVITLNYEGQVLTLDCLKALDAQSFEDFEIIVVDNHSTDNSLVEIRKFKETYPLRHPLTIVPLIRNEGFAGGNLAGLNAAKSGYVALLNNDTEPHKDWLYNLVTAMDTNPDVGICASKLLVFGADVIDSTGDGFSTALKGFKRGEGENRRRYDTQEYVFGACAGAVLYRRVMIDEIGFLDEDFFLVHEDTDMNFRAQLAGWKVLYVPTAVVHHKVRSTIRHMSEIAVYYTLRNTEFVRIKNIQLSIFLRCLPAFLFGAVFEFLYFAVRHRKPALYLKAKMDAARKLGMMLEKRRKIMSSKKVSDAYIHSIIVPVWDRNFLLSKIKKFFHG
ncbi:MAG: glycosyltransferase family 2 protein [Nitrospirae bacterium]|nr:glycosyltransferase family 2 protein [Nitrospirota bacterium]